MYQVLQLEYYSVINLLIIVETHGLYIHVMLTKSPTKHFGIHYYDTFDTAHTVLFLTDPV